MEKEFFQQAAAFEVVVPHFSREIHQFLDLLMWEGASVVGLHIIVYSDMFDYSWVRLCQMSRFLDFFLKIFRYLENFPI